MLTAMQIDFVNLEQISDLVEKMLNKNQVDENDCSVRDFVQTVEGSKHSNGCNDYSLISRDDMRNLLEEFADDHEDNPSKLPGGEGVLSDEQIDEILEEIPEDCCINIES